jgi:hypothetical protein
VQNRPQTGSQPVPATYVVHITVLTNNFYEYNNEKKKKKTPHRAEALSRLGLATPRSSPPTHRRSSSPPPVVLHRPRPLGRRSSSPTVMVVGGCLPVVVVCRPPVAVVQHPPLALFVGSLWSSLFLPALSMFVLLLLSFVPPSLLGTISTPHPPCEQWLAAADVGARIVLLWWCWGHPLVVLGCWRCPFIVVVITASSHLLPVLEWLGL